MSVEHLSVTISDLALVDWKETVANAPHHRCQEYSRLFLNHALQLEESQNGTPSDVEVWRLLAAVTSSHLRAEATASPFSPQWIASFSDDHIVLFETLLPQVEDAEFKARLCDLVWLRSRRPEAAREGVKAYLNSASLLEDGERWTTSARRYERAVHLGRSISKKGKNAAEFDLALQTVESVLVRMNGEDPLYFSATMAELLQGYKAGDRVLCATLAEKAALNHEHDIKWEVARRYREIQAEWLWQNDDNDAARAARLECIELYVKEAQHLIGQTQGAMRYLRACSILESAIKALRELGGPGSRERREEIYQLLREYQPQGVAELPAIKIEHDEKMQQMDARLRKEMMDGIYGQSLLLALAHLAGYPLMNGATELRVTCEEHLRRSPIAMMFPFKAHTSTGFVTGRPPTGPLTEEERLQIEIDHQWHHYGNEARNHYVRMLIAPAVEAIYNEHSPQMNDLRFIVRDNPFIPVEREPIFLMGLHAGLVGDFVTAVHLLFPQIENALRVILEERGITTSAFDRQEIQNQFDLNRMFNTPEIEAALVDIFDENVVFHLKGVLVHHFGANLRNELAHGTLGIGNFNGFHGPQCIFFWWICLHLCLTSFLTALVEKMQDQESESLQEA